MADAIKEAVNIGYRHFDTAQAYGNERGVGEGIRNCGIPRDEIFVTSKVAAEHKTYDEAMAGIDETIKKIGLDYLDMMIIHSPQPWEKVNQSEDRYVNGNREAWKALEDSYKAGKLKAIGLSNFRIGDIENILEVCEIKPMVNQILLHISNTPLELVEYCQGKDIIVEAYSPIAHGEILHLYSVVQCQYIMNHRIFSFSHYFFSSSKTTPCLGFLSIAPMILWGTYGSSRYAISSAVNFILNAPAASSK